MTQTRDPGTAWSAHHTMRVGAEFFIFFRFWCCAVWIFKNSVVLVRYGSHFLLYLPWIFCFGPTWPEFIKGSQRLSPGTGAARSYNFIFRSWCGTVLKFENFPGPGAVQSIGFKTWYLTKTKYALMKFHWMSFPEIRSGSWPRNRIFVKTSG